MKVILKQEVKGLGKKENLVEVSDGYANNFLFPKGLAVQANSTNMNIMNSKMEAEKSKKDRELSDAKILAEKLAQITLNIKSKAGENNKLFGSITSKDISEKLKIEYKLDIDKRKICLDDPIRSIGTYEIETKLYSGVISKLKIKVSQE